MKRTEPPGEVFLSTARSVPASSGRERFINANLIPLYQRPQPQSAPGGYNTRSIIHRTVEWKSTYHILKVNNKPWRKPKRKQKERKEMASQSGILEERRNRREGEAECVRT